MRGHYSVRLVTMGSIHPLVKHGTIVTLITNKYWSHYTILILRGLNTNLLHLQVENIWEGIST